MSRVRSMRGVEINMAALVTEHNDTVAIGNARMNARGDILGPGGRVVKSRDQVATEYYAANPNAVVSQVSLNDIRGEVMTPAEAVQKAMAAIEPEAPRRRKLTDGS